MNSDADRKCRKCIFKRSKGGGNNFSKNEIERYSINYFFKLKIYDDCDGQTDEGLTNTYYADTDADGYGDPAATVQACIPPMGYVSNNTDCDDNDPLEKPGQVWYADLDNDGYSNGNTLTQCLRPNGHKTDQVSINGALQTLAGRISDPVTVAGLPCGWSSTSGSVGCASSASYAPATSVWDLAATNCYNASPFTSDAIAFAQRTICGNGSITTQVNAIAGAAGWAGVIMRESNAPGAKKVQLTTNRINFRRREFRVNTDGPAQPQHTPSQNRFWLRIERQGNQFRCFTSSNGVSWTPAGVSNISMGACIEIGLVVINSSPNSTTSATFSNVSHTSASSPLLAPVASPTPEEGLETPGFHVFPNPTTGEINIELTPYAGRGVRIEV